MEDINRRAQRDAPGLREWVNRLLDLTSDRLENVRYDEDDHFGFMALCFVSKQIDHMRSILALDDNRDVWLIVRSMLEGMSQFLWAANDPDTRALQWRAFAWIHDWRLMRARIEAGEAIDSAQQNAIEDVLRQYGDQFLTQRARAARSRGAALPHEPYYDNWTGHTVREIFDAVGGETLYRELYKPFANWHHWSPGGLGEAISRHEQQVVFLPSSPADTATALATGFQCLLQTTEVANRHLRLGLESRLAEIRDDYMAWGQAQRNTGPISGN